ncbi:UGSC family (seleno)protein [Nocardia sp. CA-135953]|uniref:UGSC family (seleno)protein n=1 Tax=Nocardia sp. CA-135953 TaxID=3239978 RepID=UPI003D986D15
MYLLTMEISEIAEAAARLREAVSGGGVDFKLVRVDLRRRQVEFQLDLESAECADCVLPADALQKMADSALKRSHPGNYAVLIDDPRAEGESLKDASEGAVPQAGATPRFPDSVLRVVDPCAAAAVNDADPGPTLDSLAGKRIGFRVDVLWRSWDWVVDEWAAGLRAIGAVPVIWRRSQGLDGEAGRDQNASYGEFLASVDAVVCGLANCGSCTSWTVKDAVTALSAGLPTVAVATAHFRPLAQTLAAQYGRSGLRVHQLPYPLDIRPEPDVREMGREHFADFITQFTAANVAVI